MASVLLRRRVVRIRDVSRVVIRLGLLGLLMVWAMFVASPVWSQTCYEYRVQNSNGIGFSDWHPTPEGACEDGVASSASVTYVVTDVSKSRSGPDAPYAGQCSWLRTCNSGACGPQTVSLNYGWRVAVNGCPPPDQCDDNPALGVGQSFTTPLAPSSGGGDYCNAVSKCRMRVDRSVSVSGTTLYTVTHTNEQCSAGQEPTDDEEFQRESCTTTSAGNEFCLAKDGENCGWFNGEFVCLPQIDDDGCGVFSDGGRICGPDAPTPPVPDNDTPGNPAAPDDTIEARDDQGNETTYNYYDNDTVNNSHRPPGTSGDNPYDGDDGTGVGGGAGGGAGGGGGEGLMCDPESDAGCNSEGEAGEESDLREGWQCWAEGGDFAGAVAECFSDATEAVWNGLVNDASLLQIANETAAAWPAGGGGCPSDVVNIGWLNASFDFWEVPCTFLDDVEALLGPLFLLMWSLMGLRILLTIPGGE